MGEQAKKRAKNLFQVLYVNNHLKNSEKKSWTKVDLEIRLDGINHYPKKKGTEKFSKMPRKKLCKTNSLHLWKMWKTKCVWNVWNHFTYKLLLALSGHKCVMVFCAFLLFSPFFFFFAFWIPINVKWINRNKAKN